MYKFGNEPSRVTVAKVQTFSISPIALWKYWINRFSGCYIKEKEEASSETSSCGDLVRWARLELAQAYAHYPLKVACLPFHHHRFFVLGLQRYDNNFNLQIFLQFF